MDTVIRLKRFWRQVFGSEGALDLSSLQVTCTSLRIMAQVG